MHVMPTHKVVTRAMCRACTLNGHGLRRVHNVFNALLEYDQRNECTRPRRGLSLSPLQCVRVCGRAWACVGMRGRHAGRAGRWDARVWDVGVECGSWDVLV